MKIHTQNDFAVAIMAKAIREQDDDAPLDDATQGFLEFFRLQRTDEEKQRLFDIAERVSDTDAELPTSEQLKELSDIFLEMPKDDWELLEMQHNVH